MKNTKDKKPNDKNRKVKGNACKNEDNTKDNIKHPYSQISSVASVTECTGLTRYIPDDDEQDESFEDIYDIPLD